MTDLVPDEMVAELTSSLGGRVEVGASSAALTTYRCGGPLGVLARVHDEAELSLVVQVARRCAMPVLVIGRGSNLLVSERGFSGVAVSLGGRFDEVHIGPGTSTVRAGAGVALPVLARRTAAAGMSGLEFYVGIPGSVGGAVRMNAGGHGRETRDVLVRARVLAGRDGAVNVCPVSELGLGYRRSAIGADDVVLEATFAVGPDRQEACQERIDEIVRWRRENQPGGANAGSVFANPPGDHAGRLIEACGLRGLRIGGAQVSARHANFVVADPGASADDVRRLIDEVRSRVAEATGVVLRTEIRMVGFGGPGEEMD